MSRRSDAGRGALEDLQASRCTPAAAADGPVAELEAILERVRRLRCDHNNPERFHSERSDVAGAIGGLLKRMRGEPQRKTMAAPAAARARAIGLLPRLPAESRNLEHLVLRASRPILHLKDHR